MLQNPASPKHKLLSFALGAIALVWCALAADWSLAVRPAAVAALGDARQVLATIMPSWSFLLLALALLASLMVAAGRCQQLAIQRQAAARIALLRQMIDCASEAMILTDATQRILSVNAAFEQTTGYSAAEVLGLQPATLGAGDDGPNFHRSIWDYVAESGLWSGEVWDRRKDGKIYPKQMRITAIRDEAKRISHFVTTFTDISEAKLQAERFDYLTHHDQLTKLPNRLALDSHLDYLLDSTVSGINRLALLVIDLDNFKTLNDSLGHQAGDRLLTEIARRLAAEMDRSKRLFRLGGDEFVVLVDHFDNDDAVLALVERLIRAIGQPCEIDGHQLRCTSSIGISHYPDDGRDGATLIRNADAAMHVAKATGRNNTQFFASAMNVAAQTRLHLESDLWLALAENQLVLHYQPQIDLLSGELVGVEALARWSHPLRGIIAPSDFIPVAESCGLIVPLGDWVLTTACRQAKAWIDAGVAMGEMAVNISPHQFRQPDFVRKVEAVLAETGLPAKRLELEITESTVMHGVDKAIETLTQLRAMGVRLAIDDFGTGYSSLSYLRRFPIDRLKIDRSFLADVETDSDAASLVTSIVMLSRSLGLQVVAEGVESFAQAEFLRTLECERVQGFHFYPPVSAEEVVDCGQVKEYVALAA